MYIDFEYLGKRIAQRRHELGYKQNELAEKLTYLTITYQILKMDVQFQV